MKDHKFNAGDVVVVFPTEYRQISKDYRECKLGESWVPDIGCVLEIEVVSTDAELYFVGNMGGFKATIHWDDLESSAEAC